MDTDDDDFETPEPLPPAALALMHLDAPVGTLTPAQVALLLGNDPGFIAQLMRDDEDQAAQWSEDALLASRGEPDPLLVEASGGADAAELAEVNLGEAREWTKSAQAKRHALWFLEENPRPRARYSVDATMGRVQEAAERKYEQRWTCEEECGTFPCERHAERQAALDTRKDQLVAAMRAEFLAAFEAENPRAGSRAAPSSPSADPGVE